MSQSIKTVIITGAMGFIGSHTAKAFRRAGYRVIGIDREMTIPSAAHFLDELIVDDFVNITATVAKINNVDAIIHIAGTSLVGPSIADPGEYYRNNTAKTNQMLDDLALAGWTGTLIFSSSAAVYGNDYVRRWVETDRINPISPYGHSKAMCEQIIRDHTHAYGHRSIALRYFNACGCDPDGELGNVWDDTHLVPRVVQNMLKDQTVVINGGNFKTEDGTCVRDYVHVSDIADAHVRAVELCSKSLDKSEFRVYNIGTGTGISNLEIVLSLEMATDQTVKYSIGPRRSGDPDELVADPARFKADTGWEPKHSHLANIAFTTFNWSKQFKESTS